MWVFLLPSKPIHKLKELPTGSGIYYVTAFWIIFYVGKAVNLRHRWSNHHRFQQFQQLAPFGRLHYRLVARHAIAKQEKADIKRLKPHWNNQPQPTLWSLLILFLQLWLRLLVYGVLCGSIVWVIFHLYFSKS
jgi:excinuclease UvrABC nuclease subunit